MEIVTHVLTNEQHYLDDKRKKTARSNIEAIGSIKINGNVEDNVKGDVADLSGVVVPTPSADDNQKVLTAGNDGSYGWNALPEGLAPYDGEPAMDGEASAGSSALIARGDHVHPSDTSKANKSEMSVTTDGDRTTITLKEDTYATVINAHQDISGKVDKVEGKGLSTNDFTDNDKDKLDNIEDAAQVNAIESISIKNTALTIDANKNVDIPLSTSEVDGLLPKEKFPLIPAVPLGGADRIYSFDDTNGTSWQKIVREYVGNMLLDQNLAPVTSEDGSPVYDEDAVSLWLSYKGVEFGARRAYDDHTGANIHDSIASRTTMAQVTTAIETALAKYGGFVVVNSLVDGHPDVADPSARFIYLYKDSQSSAEDPYTEWIYTASGTWDKIGTTSIDVSNFTHKVANATGNIPKLDSNGDLADSGISASDVATSVQNSHSHSNKAVLDEIPVKSGTDSAMLYSADDSSSIAWKNWSYVTVSKKTTNSVLIGKNWYPYVKIGDLYWTTENLREPIGTKNTDYWIYDENTVVERGYIYKHNAVLKGVTGVESDELLALLHDGWHIPTKDEAGDLIGREPYYENNGNVFFATDADRITPQRGIVCTDKYGFHAYPSGTYRASGYGYSDIGFHNVDTTAKFYTKTYYPAAGQVYAFYARFHDGSGNSASFTATLGGDTGMFGCVRLCKSAT